MKNAQTLLNGYVTPQGLPFDYVEGEELLVDSFNYTSLSRKVSYVAFVTNKRIILKQTKTGLSINANGGIGEAFHADMRFIWFKNAKYLRYEKGKLVVGGSIVDFSEEGDTDDYDYALIATGFGGMTYNGNAPKLLSDLNAAFKKVCAEYNISYKSFNPGDTTSTPQEDKFYMNKFWGWRKVLLGALLVPAAAFVGFAGYTIANMDWDTETQTQAQVEQIKVAPEPEVTPDQYFTPQQIASATREEEFNCWFPRKGDPSILDGEVCDIDLNTDQDVSYYEVVKANGDKLDVLLDNNSVAHFRLNGGPAVRAVWEVDEDGDAVVFSPDPAYEFAFSF